MLRSCLTPSVALGDLVVVGDQELLRHDPASTEWFLGEVIQTTVLRASGRDPSELQIWNVDSGAVTWEQANRVTRVFRHRDSDER